jgi:hypothetical protein
MKRLCFSIVVLLVIIEIIACSTETQSECSCMGVALEISASGTNGSEITLDSIKYKYKNGQVETIVKDADGNIDGFVGYDVGEYKVWVYYGETVSDTAIMSVEMGGPDNCRRPSTEKIEFKFENGNYQGMALSKIGGCGE